MQWSQVIQLGLSKRCLKRNQASRWLNDFVITFTDCHYPGSSRQINCLNDFVQPASPLQQPNWDALVGGHPDGSFFHSTGWGKVLSDTYGYIPNYFVSKDAGEIRSLLAVMEVDSWLTGRRGIALPFTDNCEPIAPDATSFAQLFQSAIHFGKKRGWKYLECRGGAGLFQQVVASVKFYGHTLNLLPGEEQLWNQLESPVRRAIRKAEKAGVGVGISQDLEALRIFYSLQCQTRKKHGLPPQPFEFFFNIHKHILSQNQGVIALARWRNIPVAGSVYFHMGNRAIYKFGASDENFQHLRGANLVMWQAIKWYLRRGTTQLHLGRTSLGHQGLRRFKLGWDAAEQVIQYFKYDLRQERFVADADQAFGWHNRIFQVLPSLASQMVGKVLYRHWA